MNSITEDATNSSTRSLARTANRNTAKTFLKKQKGCPLATTPDYLISYKNPALLSKFISEHGRILPRRITNVSAKKQRVLDSAIKFARTIALL